MINVYFENKVIIFSCKSYIKDENFITFDSTNSYSIPNREIFFEQLKNVDGALIISNTPYDTLMEFSKEFKQIIAAGGIVTNKEDKILMIYRHNRWDLPKGKIEINENIEECAIREVTEECSIAPLIINDKICSTFHIYTLNGEWIIKESHWYRMTYHGDETPKPQIEEHITIAEWVDKSEVDERLKNSYSTIIDIFKEYNKNNL